MSKQTPNPSEFDALRAKAREIEKAIPSNKVWVTADDGRHGPFHVTVKRLSEDQVPKVVAAILEAIGESPAEGQS